MKIMMEKHICDGCGCEVSTETRYTVTFSAYDNWSDDTEPSLQISKDLCYDCYTTFKDMIGETKVEKKPEVPAEQPKKRKRGVVDKEKVLKLWAMGCTHKQIADNVGIARSTVNNVIYMASKEEKDAAKEKYGVHRKYVVKNEPDTRVITDEYGCVQRIERG